MSTDKKSICRIRLHTFKKSLMKGSHENSDNDVLTGASLLPKIKSKKNKSLGNRQVRTSGCYIQKEILSPATRMQLMYEYLIENSAVKIMSRVETNTEKENQSQESNENKVIEFEPKDTSFQIQKLESETINNCENSNSGYPQINETETKQKESGSDISNLVNEIDPNPKAITDHNIESISNIQTFGTHESQTTIMPQNSNESIDEISIQNKSNRNKTKTKDLIYNSRNNSKRFNSRIFINSNISTEEKAKIIKHEIYRDYLQNPNTYFSPRHRTSSNKTQSRYH